MTNNNVFENRPNNPPATVNQPLIHCLITDDNKVNQFAMRKILENLGYAVELAGNGEEGLNKLKSRKYSFAIFDYQMPIMNGLQAISTWRKQEQSPRIPIIVWTDITNNDTHDKFQEAGADEFLEKPASTAKVKRVLETLNLFPQKLH